MSLVYRHVEFRMINISNQLLKTTKLKSLFDTLVSHEVVMEFIILDFLICKVKELK